MNFGIDKTQKFHNCNH